MMPFNHLASVCGLRINRRFSPLFWALSFGLPLYLECLLDGISLMASFREPRTGLRFRDGRIGDSGVEMCRWVERIFPVWFLGIMLIPSRVFLNDPVEWVCWLNTPSYGPISKFLKCRPCDFPRSQLCGRRGPSLPSRLRLMGSGGGCDGAGIRLGLASSKRRELLGYG